MFAAIIGVFLTSNVALAEKHHSSDDDTTSSLPPSENTAPGSNINNNCKYTLSKYCAAHDIGNGIGDAVNGVIDGLFAPTNKWENKITK